MKHLGRLAALLGLILRRVLRLRGARRIRDLLIFVPGLFAWQLAESVEKGHVRTVDALSPAVATRARGA